MAAEAAKATPGVSQQTVASPQRGFWGKLKIKNLGDFQIS
jgi:hypothetical protein